MSVHGWHFEEHHAYNSFKETPVWLRVDLKSTACFLISPEENSSCRLQSVVIQNWVALHEVALQLLCFTFSGFSLWLHYSVWPVLSASPSFPTLCLNFSGLCLQMALYCEFCSCCSPRILDPCELSISVHFQCISQAFISYPDLLWASPHRQSRAVSPCDGNIK